MYWVITTLTLVAWCLIEDLLFEDDKYVAGVKAVSDKRQWQYHACTIFMVPVLCTSLVCFASE
jgi:hypothetical protein